MKALCVYKLYLKSHILSVLSYDVLTSMWLWYTKEVIVSS